MRKILILSILFILSCAPAYASQDEVRNNQSDISALKAEVYELKQQIRDLKFEVRKLKRVSVSSASHGGRGHRGPGRRGR